MFTFLALTFLCAAPEDLTIQTAVQSAIQNYPAIRVSSEKIEAASAAIRSVRTAYLPKADLYGQVNRATRNNVFGLLLPQSSLPSISGPPRPENDMTSVWGSATGLSFAWEPFDFGLRDSRVRTAEAAERRAESVRARTRLEIAALAADSFLAVLAAEQAAKSAEANLQRSKTVAEMVKALVDSELRPGADLNRTESDLAAAEIQSIQARQSIAITKASLVQFAGGDPAAVQVASGHLLDAPSGDLQLPPPPAHPLLMEQRAATEEAAAKLKEYERAYFPKFLLQGAGYARGTGAIADGTTLGGVNGLGPNIFNWGLGFSVMFPILDLPGIRAKRLEQQADQRAEVAKEGQISQELTANLRKAQAALEGARLVAQKTPVQLASARKTLEQLAARYKSGLGTLVEVADAQRLVAQAEIDDSLARLQVWRALLSVAVAQGDIEPFLRLAAQ